MNLLPGSHVIICLPLNSVCDVLKIISFLDVYVVFHVKDAYVQKLNDNVFLRSVLLAERQVHV